MDIAHNKITQELPFDAVSNQINSSITQYKDGKDQHLIGGSTDVSAKRAIIEQFYKNIKEELLKDGRGENEIDTNGTSIGRFLVTKDNDMVEKSTESLASELGSTTMPLMKLMLKNQVIPVCAMSVKLSKNVKDVVKKDFTKNLPKITSPSNYNSYKEVYVKSVLEQTVGEKDVDISFGSLKEYLRDTINIFSRNRDDTKAYFSRYIKRYEIVSDICSKLALSVNEMFKILKELLEKNKDGIPKSIKDNTLEKISEKSTEITSLYDKLLSQEYTDNEDFFTLVSQNYKFDVMNFAVKKAYDYGNDYSGITKRELLEFVKQKKNMNPEADKGKTVFATIYSPKGVSKIIEGVQAKYNDTVSMELLMDKQKKSLFSVVEDMTVGEFYEQLDKFNEYTKDFKADVDEVIAKLIDSTTRAANITGTLATYTLRALDTFGNMQQPADYNIAMLILSVASWTCIDLMTVVNSLHYINANDLVMKMYLYENTVNFVKYIDDCIQSWRK